MIDIPIRLTLLASDDSWWANDAPVDDFYSLPAFTKLEAEWTGGESCALRIEVRDQQVVLPLIRRPFGDAHDYSSPYGYPWPALTVTASELASVFQSIRTWAETDGALSVFLRTHPLFTPSLRELTDVDMVGVKVVPVNNTFSLDLTVPDLLASYHKNVRRDIRRAQREQLDVELTDEWKAAEIATMYDESMRRLQASAYFLYDDDYFARLRQATQGSHFIARVFDRDAELVAFGMFVTSKDISQYHISAGSSSHPLRGYATKLMLHEAAVGCGKAGSHRLHLGGAPRGNTGLLEMKRRFSSDQHEYHVVEIVPNQKLYENRPAQVAAKSGFFPAYRRP